MRIFLFFAGLTSGFIFFQPLCLAQDSEVELLRKEVQELKGEVKDLKEELKSVKKMIPQGAVQEETAGPAGSAKEKEVTKEDLQGVRSEVQSLRDDYQRQIDKKTAVTTRSLSLGGIVQTRYTYTQDKNPADGYRGFSIPQIILSLKGSLRKDYEKGRNLDYLFSLSSDLNLPLKDFRVKPLDVYLTYAVLPTNDPNSPRLSITFGQQKKPFGRDPQTTEEYKPTIKLSQIDTNLNLGVRDIGVVVAGDAFPVVDYGFNYRVPFIEYYLAVINGPGYNQNDDNYQKDYVGRIVLNAPVDYYSIFRGLSLGGSVYNGNKSLVTGAVRRRLNRNRIGADLAYVRTPVGFTAEFAQGQTDSSYSLVGNNTTVKEGRGYILSLFYNFGKQFVRGYKAQNRYDDWYPLTYQPFFRYDHWDPNIHAGADTLDIYTIGFNWFFAETTKLQLNYNIRREKSSKLKNNEFLVQFQYGF